MATTNDSTTEGQGTPVYRNRKTFLGYLVRPKQQIKSALFFIAGTWLVHLVLLYCLIQNMNQLNEITLTAHVLVAAAALSFFAIVTGVLVSHALFGPLVSIKRHIAHLREGQYNSRLSIRSTDDLGEMKDALNDLAAALESRHGSGKRAPS